MPNQSLQETENTYKIICDTIIKAVSSSKHYLYFLPDKRNIDNAIKLGALYMRDDYSNTSDLEKLGISEGILLPQDFNRDDFLERPPGGRVLSVKGYGARSRTGRHASGLRSGCGGAARGRGG